jgi:hypothetical protein
MRKLTDYKMQLAIVQNPHTENPGELWKLLESQDPHPPEPFFDQAGMDRLKGLLSKSTAIQVK